MNRRAVGVAGHKTYVVIGTGKKYENLYETHLLMDRHIFFRIPPHSHQRSRRRKTRPEQLSIKMKYLKGASCSKHLINSGVKSFKVPTNITADKSKVRRDKINTFYKTPPRTWNKSHQPVAKLINTAWTRGLLTLRSQQGIKLLKECTYLAGFKLLQKDLIKHRQPSYGVPIICRLNMCEMGVMISSSAIIVLRTYRFIVSIFKDRSLHAKNVFFSDQIPQAITGWLLNIMTNSIPSFICFFCNALTRFAIVSKGILLFSALDSMNLPLANKIKVLVITPKICIYDYATWIWAILIIVAFSRLFF